MRIITYLLVGCWGHKIQVQDNQSNHMLATICLFISRVLNLPQHQGQFNFTSQFPYYKEIFYKPDFKYKKIGQPLVFDMDMSAGDFLALIFLLKVPVEVLDLKAILVNCIGWANAATIDIIYDVLHMMGRDDKPVGLGNLTAVGIPILGCKFVQAIPHGSGGFIDTDTLYGLACILPRSPRRFTAENIIKYGYLGNSDQPELRQLSALEVWQSISRKVDPTQKVTVLTNGPLTNLANIILSDKKASSMIQNLFVVGGNVIGDHGEEGNIFTIPSNKYAEFNMYLDPLAAKIVFESDLEITLIPLHAQRQVSSFPEIIRRLQLADKTPELEFSLRLLSLLHKLQQKHQIYHHMDIFLGEILGAVFLTNPHVDPLMQVKPIKVSVGNTATDGQIFVDETKGKVISILHDLDSEAYYGRYATLLSSMNQSAVVGSFDEQKKQWSSPPDETQICATQRRQQQQ